MALTKWGKTEHGGPKGRGRKSGYWGTRTDARDAARKARREAGKSAMQHRREAGDGSTLMSMNLADWESAAPWIDWREPVEVRLIGHDEVHYACRVCIAVLGMKGADIPRLPTDPAEVRRHIARAHLAQEQPCQREV